MKLHILGIAGTFMGGVAALARELGHEVEGSDQAVYPPMSTQLEQLGIALKQGYSPDNISADCDTIVIGNALSRGNSAVEAVLDAGRAYTSGAEWLRENVLPGRDVMAVAGTHGKTTTTTILSYLLDRAGRDPGFLIGGVAEDFGVSARTGTGREFVVEADEYDTAFFDKRSKFVHYRPRTAVLNNLEFDHADIFDDLAQIERQFHHLVRTVPASGRVVVNGLEESLQRVLAQGCWSGQRSFGAAVSDFTAHGDASDFEVQLRGQPVGRVRWDLSGTHNQLNALAAIAAAEHVGVAPAEACAALASFQNVRRRMEVRGRVAQADGAEITVYDDFAHHPTAIRTTVDGLRRQLDAAGKRSERILAIFEPRSNTMKLGTMKSQLPWSLEHADLSFCHTGGLDWDAAAALAPLGAHAQVAASVDEIVRQVIAAARPGDHLLCMSNGGFGGVHTKLMEELQKHR